MKTNNLSREDLVNILYPFYLEEQKALRQRALRLLEENKIKDLLKLSHYCDGVLYTKKLETFELSKVIEELNSIEFPPNTGFINVCTYHNTEDIFIEYTVYSVPSEEICKLLAKHWAEDSAWRALNRPNSKEGKRVIEMLNNL